MCEFKSRKLERGSIFFVTKRLKFLGRIYKRTVVGGGRGGGIGRSTIPFFGRVPLPCPSIFFWVVNSSFGGFIYLGG